MNQMTRGISDRIKMSRAVFLPFLLISFCLTAAILLSACGLKDVFEQKGKGRIFDGTFMLCVTMGEDDPRTKGARYFSDLIEEYSGGRLHCEVKTGMELGSDASLIQKIMRDTGEVDIIIVSGGFFADYTDVSQCEIPALPYFLTDFETAWAFADSDLMADFEAELPKENLRVLSHFCAGFRCLTNSQHPVRTPDDLKGLVIRTPAGSTVMDVFFELGAKAMPLPFGELKDALEKGYYDGQENPPSTIYYNGLYECQKYLAITNHNYMIQNFTIAESIWQQLTEEEQEIVLRAAKDATAFERQLVVEENDMCLKKLEELGMEISYPDLTLFREATEKLRQEKTEKYIEDYERALKWLEEHT